MASELDGLNNAILGLAQAVNIGDSLRDSRKFLNYQYDAAYDNSDRFFEKQMEQELEYYNKFTSPSALRKAAAAAGLNFATLASGSNLDPNVHAGNLPSVSGSEFSGSTAGLSALSNFMGASSLQAAQADYYRSLSRKVDSETGDPVIYQAIQSASLSGILRDNEGRRLSNLQTDYNNKVLFETIPTRIEDAKASLEKTYSEIAHFRSALSLLDEQTLNQPYVRQQLDAQARLMAGQVGFYRALEELNKSNNRLTSIQIREAWHEFCEQYYGASFEVSFDSTRVSTFDPQNADLLPAGGEGHFYGENSPSRNRVKASQHTANIIKNESEKSDYGYPALEWLDDNAGTKGWATLMSGYAAPATNIAASVLSRFL